MIFSVCRPQYFISHTKSQRLLVTRHRLFCEKVNLHNTLVTWSWDACALISGWLHLFMQMCEIFFLFSKNISRSETVDLYLRIILESFKLYYFSLLLNLHSLREGRSQKGFFVETEPLSPSNRASQDSFLVGSFCGQIFPRRNLFTRGRK